MHITLTANTDWYLFNFRGDLARALRTAGYRVSLVCPDGPYVKRLRDEGFEVVTFMAPSDGFSLAGNRRALREITAAYRALQPDLVHLFTPVCVLLGSIAARRCAVPYQVAALTGLGHVFTSTSLKARLAQPLLRQLFRRELGRPGTAVIFQNEADQQELINAGVVRAGQCHLVRGSGVDVDRFRPAEEREQEHGSDPRPAGRGVRVLFASRLLGEKGIRELVEAFEQVRQQAPDTELWIAGKVYPPNPTSLTPDEVEALAQRPGIRLLGHVEDMAGLFEQVDIVALPSYREGTPKVLLEAAACGLPIVATDIPGCRGLVVDGESGYLVPVKSVEPLAERLLGLVQDAGLRGRFGRRGREIVVDGFSMQRVITDTQAIYARLVSASESGFSAKG